MTKNNAYLHRRSDVHLQNYNEQTWKPSSPQWTDTSFFRIVGTSIGAILLTNCALGCADKSNGDPTPDPNQKLDFTLRLSDKANENLMVKGGYVISNNVIIAQTKAGQFIAVSANCTHEGTQLIYRANDNQFYCPLHLSRFDPAGKVLFGPATQPLTQYIVESDTAAGTVRVHS